jgi:CHAT domain-containing protein
MRQIIWRFFVVGWCIVLTIGTTTLAVTDSDLLEAQRAFEQGQFSQAIKQWEEIWPQLRSKRQKIDVLLQLAAAYQSLGLAQKSVTALSHALSNAKQVNDKIRQALILGSLSDFYLLSRDLDKADKYAQQSVQLVCRPVESPLACATALNYHANVLSLQENYQRALETYQQSLALAHDAPVFSVKLRTNLLQLEFKRDNFEAALSQMKALPDSHDKVFGLLKLGYLAIERAEMKLIAYQTLQEAWQLAYKRADKRAMAYAKGYLGKLYEKYGRNQEAERLTRQAIFLTRQSGVPKMLSLRQSQPDKSDKRYYLWNEGQDYAPEMLYLWQWQLGRLRQAQNDLQGAIAAYQHAVNNLETLRLARVRGYRSPPQAKTADSVYYDLADLWLQAARRATDDSQRKKALVEARDTLELLKAVELENYFQDDCVTALQAKRRNIDDILIEAHTAVLYPMIFSERVELLLSLSGGRLKQFTVTSQENPNATKAKLAKIVKEFQRQLRKPSSNYRRLLLNARTLYEVFIKKIVAEVQDVKTLIIVPDSLLRTIPFGALHDGRQFLIERYALAITPGLSLTEAPKTLKRDKINMLMAGLSEPVLGFSPLPHVVESIEAIKQICPTTTPPLINRNFTKTQVRSNLEQTAYTLVHFATHGKFEPHSALSFLLAYDDKLNLNELEQFMSFSQFREEPVELLTLSACETAVGDEQAALGLAGVAVKAGARSAVASLWLVDVESTVSLMESFYSAICNRPNLSKAQALQQAQQTLLASGRRYKHPYYWAAFLVIGNWF